MAARLTSFMLTGATLALTLGVSGCTTKTVVIVLPASTTIVSSPVTDASEPVAIETDQFVATGHSMDPAITDGDVLNVDVQAYLAQPPARGDVVIVRTVGGAGEQDLVKRIVAVSGDTIEYRSCVLTIDGAEQLEPWVAPSSVTGGSCGGDQALLVVPEGHVFVMGDNRGGSKDSRDIGPIDVGDLVGRVVEVTGVDGVTRPVDQFGE